MLDKFRGLENEFVSICDRFIRLFASIEKSKVLILLSDFEDFLFSKLLHKTPI